MNGRKISRNPPRLWLGHLIGSEPRPWLDFEVPGVIVNAYQMRKKIASNSFTLEHLSDECNNSPVMIDSGGYNFIKDPDKIPAIEPIANMYRKIEAEIVVSLDLPPHPNLSPRERSRRWKKTKENAFKLTKLLENRSPMPVVHGYSEKELRNNSRDVSDLIEESKMIGLGGMVPLLKVKRSKTLSLIHYLRTLYPDKMLHVFGAGSVSTMMLLTLLRVDSMDTIGWRIKAAFGAIQLPGMSDRFVTPNQESKKSRLPLSKSDLELLKKCNCPICRGRSLKNRLNNLDNADPTTFHNRATHNAWVFVEELKVAQEQYANGSLADFLHNRMATGYWSSSYKQVLEMTENN